MVDFLSIKTKAARIPPKYIALCLGIFFFLQAFTASLQHSLTWDEPSFIAAGYAYLKNGDFRFNQSHPPLAQYLVASPLLAMDLRHPPIAFENWTWSTNPVVSFGKALVYDGGYRPQQISFWSRLPILALGTGLVLSVFFWGRSLYGDWPALMGTAVCAFCPNLIAHSGIATEDIVCTFFVFASCWAFWGACKSRMKWHWILCGALTGLAFISKYTSLALIPSFLLIAVLCRLTVQNTITAREWFWALLKIFAVASLVVGIAYGPEFGWSKYLLGLKAIYSDLPQNMEWYLLGSFSSTPRWYYTVAAFVLKTSPAVLVLIVLAGASAFRKGDNREDLIFVLVPAFIFIAISFFDNANFGLRRILPAFPFLYLCTSRTLRSLSRQSARITTAVALILLTAAVTETILIYPHHLSFFSWAVGGPKNGPNLLNDSNIDWGQDLPALAEWQHRTGTTGLKLSYFGSANPAAYGVNAEPFPNSEQELLNPPPGTYAMSVHHLISYSGLHSEFGPGIDWLRTYKPIARAGYSIYIYQFP